MKVYTVRFNRTCGGGIEEYGYLREDDALNHLAYFRDADDSTRIDSTDRDYYESIEVFEDDKLIARIA